MHFFQPQKDMHFWPASKNYGFWGHLAVAKGNSWVYPWGVWSAWRAWSLQMHEIHWPRVKLLQIVGKDEAGGMGSRFWVSINPFMIGGAGQHFHFCGALQQYDVLYVKQDDAFQPFISRGTCQHFRSGGATANVKRWCITFYSTIPWSGGHLSTTSFWGRYSKLETLTYNVFYAKQNDFLGALVNTSI